MLLQRAGLHVERNLAGLRGGAVLRRWQHVVDHGLRAVLQLLLQRLRGWHVPLVNLHGDGEHQVHGVHGWRQLVRRQRHRLHGLHRLPGRHVQERRGLHRNRGQRVHQLYGRPLLSRARAGHDLHCVPRGGGRLRLARPRRPEHVRLQRDCGLRVEQRHQGVQHCVRAWPDVERDGLCAVPELHHLPGRLLSRCGHALHGHEQRHLRRLPGGHLFTRGRPRLHVLQRELRGLPYGLARQPDELQLRLLPLLGSALALVPAAAAVRLELDVVRLGLLALRRVRNLRRWRSHDERLREHEQRRLRDLPCAELRGRWRHGLPPVRYNTRVQHEQHSSGPDELRLQRAGLHLERDDAELRGRSGVRGRQHLLRHGLRAVLQLRLEHLRGGQVPCLNVLRDGQHKLLELRVRQQLVRRWRHGLHGLHRVPAWPGPHRHLLSHHERRMRTLRHQQVLRHDQRCCSLHAVPHRHRLRCGHRDGPDELLVRLRLCVEHRDQHVRATLHRLAYLELHGPAALQQLQRHVRRGLGADLRGLLHHHERPRLHQLLRHAVLSCGRPDLQGLPDDYGLRLHGRRRRPERLRLLGAGLCVERHLADVRPQPALRRRQHVVRHGLRAVLQLLLERLRGGQVPRLGLLRYGGRRVQQLHGRRQLVRRRRLGLHGLHRVPGRRQESLGLQRHRRHGLHELHGGPVLCDDKRGDLRGLPNRRGLHGIHRTGPEHVRLRGQLRVERYERDLHALLLRRGRQLQRLGLRALLDVRLLRGQGHDF